MSEALRTGKALYKVEYKTKTYWYYGRNPEKVSKEEENRNKRKIDGFTQEYCGMGRSENSDIRVNKSKKRKL